MKVRLKATDLPIYKRYLRDALPHVNASHRIEAMARGLGFKSYAAFIDKLNNGVVEETAVETKFQEYMASKAFTVTPRTLSRALARAMMEPHINSDTRITTHGYRLPDNYGFSGPKYVNEYNRSRAEFYEDWFCDQFELALLFIQHAYRRKTLNRDFSTYKWKHTAENISRKHGIRKDLGDYVCNGVLIIAALYDGLDVRQISWHSMSAYLNISSRNRTLFKDTCKTRKKLEYIVTAAAA